MRSQITTAALTTHSHSETAWWSVACLYRKPVRALLSGYYYRAVYGGYGTSRIGEWPLNHIHSINKAEVSLSVSSTIGIETCHAPHSRTQRELLRHDVT